MSNRHLARSIVMQVLYQWDFKGKPTAAMPAIITQQSEEFGKGLSLENGQFIHDTIDGVVSHIEEIDTAIATYAPKWPIEQMTLIDRNILRLGVYELMFGKGIPGKVAINEAIEMAKSFGGQSSGRFVNGILGAMYEGMPKRTDEPNEPEETEDAFTGEPLAL
jgi:N utilization substance protein B